MVPLSGWIGFRNRTTDDYLPPFMHTYIHTYIHTYTHSEISRNDDQLTELKTYKEFLDSLAPQVSSGQLADTIPPSSHTNHVIFCTSCTGMERCKAPSKGKNTPPVDIQQTVILRACI